MKYAWYIGAVLAVAGPGFVSAATIEATIYGRVDSFYDQLLQFGGAQAEVGDEVIARILFDPDLSRAENGWRQESASLVSVYGGSIYSSDYYGYDVLSPIISSTLSFGNASVDFKADQYGYVQLSGYPTGNTNEYANYTSLTFDGFTNDGSDRFTANIGFYSIEPSQLEAPSFSGPYDITLPSGNFDFFSATFQSYNDDLSLSSYLQFIPTRFTINELAIPPAPSPVPLPAGAPLILTGLLSFLGLRRRQKNRIAA